MKVLNQNSLSGATAAKRRCIADEQDCDLDGIMADIYEEEVDFNFVKILLLSYFRDHVQRFGDIQMYSTELGETSYKMMIKEGYCRSNRNGVSHQILQTYARLDSFKIHEMNVEANIPHSIQHKPHKRQHKCQIALVTKQLSGLAPTVEDILQLKTIL